MQAGGGAVELGTRVGEGKNRGQLNFSGHFRRLFQISGGFQEFLHFFAISGGFQDILKFQEAVGTLYLCFCITRTLLIVLGTNSGFAF